MLYFSNRQNMLSIELTGFAQMLSSEAVSCPMLSASVKCLVQKVVPVLYVRCLDVRLSGS